MIVAALTMLFGKVLAFVIFAILFLLYMIFLKIRVPKKFNAEIKELSHWKKRTAKGMMIWFPFLVMALLIYQKFWSANDNGVMIFVLGVGSLILALIVEKLFFKNK